MDKQRTKILIKKINSLYSSIEMEDGTLSAIERDLMLKYIRDLYEEFVEEAPLASAPKTIATKPKPAAPEITSAPINRPRFEAPPSTTAEAPSIPSTPAPPPASPPPAPPAPPVEPVVPPKPTPPEPKVMATPAYTTASSNENPKVGRLFAFKQAKELSEKLSQQPIKDLQTALSINDKLLYTNELFGRQHNILNDTLQTLNRFEDMNQAKNFLMSIAAQYDWTNEEREDIAQSFIKTIRRRYQ